MRDETLWTVLRLTLAGLLAAHGWARLLGNGIEPFGAWLNDQGFMIGHAIAWSVTIYEIAGTALLAAKWHVFP